jgi:hypothetical protein
MIKLLIMLSSLFPCYLVPLGPIYPPQHPSHKLPHPTFHPKSERPSLTSVQNNIQSSAVEMYYISRLKPEMELK